MVDGGWGPPCPEPALVLMSIQAGAGRGWGWEVSNVLLEEQVCSQWEGIVY